MSQGDETMRFLLVHRLDETKPDAYTPSPEMIAGVGALMGEMARAGVMLAAQGVLPSAQGAKGRVSEGRAQAALGKALDQWPESGVPSTPGAGLMGIGKPRAVDLLRRQRRFDRKLAELGRAAELEEPEPAPDVTAALDGDIQDDLL